MESAQKMGTRMDLHPPWEGRGRSEEDDWVKNMLRGKRACSRESRGWWGSWKPLSSSAAQGSWKWWRRELL